MKTCIFLSAVMAIGLFLNSCKSTQYTSENYEVPALRFGNAGGFAGTSTEYILLENGQLFHKKPRTNAFVEMEKMDMSFVRQCFANYDLIEDQAKSINVPGNMTYWLGYENGDQKMMAKWGGHEQEPDKYLKALYTNLIRIKKSDAVTLEK